MIFIIESRPDVRDEFVSQFERAGISAAGLTASDCRQWLQTAAPDETAAIEAVLVGAGERPRLAPRDIKLRAHSAMIAVGDASSLADTLELFALGFDDVVRQPIHVAEILARIGAIRRRMRPPSRGVEADGITLHADGREPEVGGKPLRLPRRERRILEYLVANRGCWVSKTQLYNCVYGVFAADIPETAIEVHVSRLRKRLRNSLGHDPISTQRFAGYRLDAD